MAATLCRCPVPFLFFGIPRALRNARTLLRLPLGVRRTRLRKALPSLELGFAFPHVARFLRVPVFLSRITMLTAGPPVPATSSRSA
jgi:hypothetical protein